MTTPAFDHAFNRLVKAYTRHDDLRRSNAAIPALSRSSQELFKARMAMRQASR